MKFAFAALGVLLCALSSFAKPLLPYVSAVLDGTDVWVKCAQTHRFVKANLPAPAERLAWVGDNIAILTNDGSTTSLYVVSDACTGSVRGYVSQITEFAIDEIVGSVAFNYQNYLFAIKEGLSQPDPVVSMVRVAPLMQGSRFIMNQNRVTYSADSILSASLTLNYDHRVIQIDNGVARFRSGSGLISYLKKDETTGQDQLYVTNFKYGFKPQKIPNAAGLTQYWIERRSTVNGATAAVVFINNGTLYAVNDVENLTAPPIPLSQTRSVVQSVQVSKDVMAFQIQRQKELYVAFNYARSFYLDNNVTSYSIRSDSSGESTVAYIKNGSLFVNNQLTTAIGSLLIRNPLLPKIGAPHLNADLVWRAGLSDSDQMRAVVVDKARNVFFLHGDTVYLVISPKDGSYELVMSGVKNLTERNGVAHVEVSGSGVVAPIDWYVCERLLI